MCPPLYSTPLCLLCLLCLASAQLDNCSKDPATLLCRGERAMRNVLRNLSKSEKPLVIMRGLEIVPLPNEVEAPPTAATDADADATLLDSLSTYLRTHELNLKLADLLDESSPSGATVAGGWAVRKVGQMICIFCSICRKSW